MNETLRELLYPIGFISSLAFTMRFLIQWIDSEKKKKSTVTPLFWKLSLVGNCFLWIHSIIQIQLHVALIQACNALISGRNLNLIQPSHKRFHLSTFFGLLFISLAVTLLLFALQTWEEANGFLSLFRIPSWFGHSQTHSVPWGWHLLGFSGLLLFSSRFWIQWWLAEKYQTSYLGASFWWMSLVGDLLCLTYFALLGDLVNFIGPAFGLLPYIRNLILIKKSKTQPSESLS